MAVSVDEFDIWLGNKLKSLDIEDGVFGSYIIGILDGDDCIEDKAEGVREMLSDLIGSDISALCKEIVQKWQDARNETKDIKVGSSEDVDEKLVRLLESQSLATTVQREYTAEERKIREAILAQYSQMTDDEDEENEECLSEAKENGMERNTNAFTVQQAEKEKREQAKVDSQKKKEKDKEDREKQKQMKEDKKEKRKTQKGERKR